MLAECVVSLLCRLQRAERLVGAAFKALCVEHTAGPVAKLTQSL
jgi:hypothetical protein